MNSPDLTVDRATAIGANFRRPQDGKWRVERTGSSSILADIAFPDKETAARAVILIAENAPADERDRLALSTMKANGIDLMLLRTQPNGKDPAINSPEALVAASSRAIYLTHLDADNRSLVRASDFLRLCRGNAALAFRMFHLCEWQHPETLLAEDSNAPQADRAFPELFDPAKITLTLGDYGSLVVTGIPGGSVSIESSVKRDAEDPAFNAALDAVESIVLAQHAEGIDITTPTYAAALVNALNAISNNL